MTASTQTTNRELGSTNLFKPIKLGNITLENRAFYAPSTRCRATPEMVPTDLMFGYYSKRSKDNGGLIITEATFISPEAGGMARVPGIWTDEQTEGWKKITEEIHKNGSYVSMQLWNLGRAADPEVLNDWNVPLVSSSDVYIDEASKEAALKLNNPLRPVTLEQIEMFKRQYVHAAKNAIKVAKMDFIEIHDAHGYLLDQFLQPSINKRTDQYGGSIENRARLALEIVDLLIAEVGADKVGIRLSPWAQFAGCLGEDESISPIAYEGYLMSELNKRKVAYLSIVEPRVPSANNNVRQTPDSLDKTNDFVYQIFEGPILRAGNYLVDIEDNFVKLRKDVNENDRTMIGFSRYFTSNPDLIKRLKYGWELTPYDRKHFYTVDNYHYDTYGFYGEPEITEESIVKQIPKAL